MDAEHHSDLTVNIYSTLSVLIDVNKFSDLEHTDFDGALSQILSTRFQQTWVVFNGLPATRSRTFHSDYLRFSQMVQNCFYSVVYVDPESFCQSPSDISVFLHTILSVNRLLKRKVLLIADNTSVNETTECYRRHVGDFANARSDSLARGMLWDGSRSFSEFTKALGDWISRI